MKKFLLIIILATISVSCCKKFYPSSVQDSIKIETRYEYIEKLRDTTVYVPVPYEMEKNVTRDTVSHLENSIAISDAMISGGLLYHSLVNKNVSLPATVAVKDSETVKDSINYRDRFEIVTQEVNVLTWRQKLWCALGKWLSGIIFLIVSSWLVKKFIFPEILKFFKP